MAAVVLTDDNFEDETQSAAEATGDWLVLVYDKVACDELGYPLLSDFQTTLKIVNEKFANMKSEGRSTPTYGTVELSTSPNLQKRFSKVLDPTEGKEKGMPIHLLLFRQGKVYDYARSASGGGASPGGIVSWATGEFSSQAGETLESSNSSSRCQIM
ncbi:unnamed protein product [Polarella glacialis]|uniref:Uncharacterized protein n=1 Tax=Polarella glacialis TaxID=89957 RepID=A0A813IG17_POLGL|nr:unnamed protein product [Polarella glacialis]|mmetsp:Transcript_33735/g.60594  ORF Transcript_33735/g.60594 Transcript_33735/m.60594 type:complete len:157 (+) Transcript_33735:78-548(+)